MAVNIMNEYIALTKKHIEGYMELIFQNKFDKAIFEQFWKSYLDIRYYDLNGYKNDNTIKNELLEELKRRKAKLLQKEEGKEKVINDMCAFFNHLLYFDRVSPNKDLGKTIVDINELRGELLDKKNDRDFKDELGKIVRENAKQIEAFLENYDCSEFYVSISNYREVSNVYRATIKYNCKMPMVYSLYAINKAFTTGTIGEDRIFIAYSLMSIQVIKDIIRGNFKKQYIVEFADTLFDKRQKVERLFNTVSNQAIQDKLIFKIPYRLFIPNKDMVYRLMKKGYRFAIIIDDSFEGTLDAIERLKVFKYVLSSENAKWYHNIEDNLEKGCVIKI